MVWCLQLDVVTDFASAGTGDAVRDSTTIERVTMGDVYVCGGQSNMQLPNLHSYSAKTLQQQLQAGKWGLIKKKPRPKKPPKNAARVHRFPRRF